MRGDFFAFKPRQEAAFARVETILRIVGFLALGSFPSGPSENEEGAIRLCSVGISDLIFLAIVIISLSVSDLLLILGRKYLAEISSRMRYVVFANTMACTRLLEGHCQTVI